MRKNPTMRFQLKAAEIGSQVWRSSRVRRASRAAGPTLAFLMLGVVCVASVPNSNVSTSSGTSKCAALTRADLASVADAPTRITQARYVSADAHSPEHCAIEGYVNPNVGFEMRFPTQNWNGKLLQIGCAGFCGFQYGSGCAPYLERGYACATSDNGHRGGALEAIWAYHNLQAKIDHAFRATHAVALAAKAIVEHYYQQLPRRSYFMGCSTGGRQALMEAQRFPWDFDGIIAESPSLVATRQHMALLWAYRSLTDDSGEPLVSEADLDRVHRAALDHCDQDDGVTDGVIGNPRACTFDPAELLCMAGGAKPCLTSLQVAAVRKVYSGPVTSTGQEIFPTGAALKGSERTWFDSFVHWPDDPEGLRKFVTEQFRYIGLDPSPGPNWEAEDFDFDRDYKRLGVAQSLYDADNPDLRTFKAAGGKLIVYTGLNDVLGLALPPIDYYEMVEKLMGGRAATQEFFRLFVLPGVGHCGGGDGAGSADWLTHLEAWVEQGQPPDKVTGFHLKPGARATLSGVPQDSESEFSRPIYPYPVLSRYSGKGDPRKAESFEAVEP